MNPRPHTSPRHVGLAIPGQLAAGCVFCTAGSFGDPTVAAAYDSPSFYNQLGEELPWSLPDYGVYWHEPGLQADAGFSYSTQTACVLDKDCTILQGLSLSLPDLTPSGGVAGCHNITCAAQLPPTVSLSMLAEIDMVVSRVSLTPIQITHSCTRALLCEGK